MLSFLPIFSFSQKKILVERQTILMGSVFNISVVDKDSLQANLYIDEAISEIDRIENLISEWRPETLISQVNRNAGIRDITVTAEVLDLTKRAIQYSKMSSGAFDISIVAMDKVWRFDGSMTEMPPDQDIKNSVRNVNYQNIILDTINSTIYLSKPGMKIGFGSIGKAYAADKAKALLMSKGVTAGIINASGDIATWGNPPNSKTWTIGIRNPFKKHKIVKILKLKNWSVVTSGSYEKFVEIGEKRFSHIINPKTGMPSTGLTSVTITGPSAEFANALSTSIMVLGKRDGLQLLKKYHAYHAIIISDKGRIIQR